MKLNVYCCRDRKIGCYANPFYTTYAKEDQVETFRRGIVSDPAKNFTLKDCELYALGTYDDKTGCFELVGKPEFIADLGDYFPHEDLKDGKQD